MKNKNLLKLLKQGNVNSLDVTITSNQFKDIEVAKYYFKNIVEQSSLVLFKNEIKYNINRNKNFVKLNNIYHLLLDESYYSGSYNYSMIKEISEYVNIENKIFLYYLLDMFNEYIKTEDIGILYNIYKFIRDNNINNEVNQYIYYFCMDSKYIKQKFRDNLMCFTKLLISKDCNIINPYVILGILETYNWFNENKDIFSEIELNRLNKIFNGMYYIEC